MALSPILEDTTLAALISSKICHDLAGQIGAINNGLELLEQESDADARYYALELIQNSAKAAWAQLDFNRLAFGASSSLGAVVPFGHVEQVAKGYIENGKRRLHWQVDVAELEKEKAKLVLAVLAVALTTLPAGGDFYIGLSAGEGAGQSANFRLLILCRGRIARIPERLSEILSGSTTDNIDGRSVLPYYAARLASDAGLSVAVGKDGDDILFTVQPVGRKA